MLDNSTVSGNYHISFDEIDTVFEFFKGTVESISCNIIKGLQQSAIVADATIKEKEFDIIFYLQYCPYAV